MRQNTQKEEKLLRELVERAGEAKGYRKRSKVPELVLVLAGNSPVRQTLQLSTSPRLGARVIARVKIYPESFTASAGAMLAATFSENAAVSAAYRYRRAMATHIKRARSVCYAT